MATVNVYIDGLNLYYGALRNSPYRWLDLRKLSRGLLKASDEVQRIRYFTALVDDPADPTVGQRQKSYIRALRSIPGLTIHYGSFVTHARTMPRTDGAGLVEVFRTDEKGSDVNLASHLLLDSCARDFEKALVVSNDSDLAFPVRAVRERFGLGIGVSCPVVQRGRRPAWLLVDAADFKSHITRKRRKLLRQSQFPNTVIDLTGRPIRKPTSW